MLFLAIADIMPIVSALNPNLTLNPNRHLTLTSYRPGGGETIWPVRPAAGPQSAYLWWPAVAKLQAASVPIIGQLRRGTDRPVSPNAPHGEGMARSGTV